MVEGSSSSDSASARNILHISEEQWLMAENYFASNPDKIKISKPVKFKATGTRFGNSFIKVGDEIYAIANGEYLGEGGYAKIKVAQNRKGDNFSIKIEGIRKNLTDEELVKRNINKENEAMVTSLIGYTKGRVCRALDEATEFKGNIIISKEYSINMLHEGIDLFYAFAGSEKKGLKPILFTKQQELIIFIKCALKILELHKQKIIHGDIKFENFIYHENDSEINISLVDYGMSKLKSDDRAAFVTGPTASGTLQYAAPEVVSDRKYSFASDIYALGKMFEVCSFYHEMAKKMIMKDPNDRVKLPIVIDYLVTELQMIPLDERLSDTSKIINAWTGKFMTNIFCIQDDDDNIIDEDNIGPSSPVMFSTRGYSAKRTIRSDAPKDDFRSAKRLAKN